MAQDNLDAFMLLKGITGECVDDQAKGRASEWGYSGSATIEVDSISISSSSAEFAPKKKNPLMTKEERERERYDNSDDGKGKYTFTVTKAPDSSTPDLFYRYCLTAYDKDEDRKSGRIEQATLWVRKAGHPDPIVYLRWDLTKVWIVKFDWSVDSSGAVTETLELYPYAMTVYYQAQNADGSAKPGGPLTQSYTLIGE